eukprot:scpid106142/ scgid20406/ 
MVLHHDSEVHMSPGPRGSSAFPPCAPAQHVVIVECSWLSTLPVQALQHSPDYKVEIWSQTGIQSASLLHFNTPTSAKYSCHFTYNQVTLGIVLPSVTSYL